MFFPLNTRYLFLFNEKEIQDLRTSEFSRRHMSAVSYQLSAISYQLSVKIAHGVKKKKVENFQFPTFSFQLSIYFTYSVTSVFGSSSIGSVPYLKTTIFLPPFNAILSPLTQSADASRSPTTFIS